MPEDRFDSLLHKLPIERRKVVKALLIGTFVVPTVASFPMDGRFEINAMASEESNATYS